MVRAQGIGMRPQTAGLVAVAASWALLAAAVVASVLLSAVEMPAPLLLAGALGVAGLVALTLMRFDVAVLLGILLLGVVRVEPAPTDAIFAVVMAAAVVTRRPEVRRVPPWAAALVAVLLLANVVSLVNASALVWGGRYMAITVYLLLLALAVGVRGPSGAGACPARRVLGRGGGCRAARHSRAAHAAARQGPVPGRGLLQGAGPVRGPERVRAVPRPRCC